MSVKRTLIQFCVVALSIHFCVRAEENHSVTFKVDDAAGIARSAWPVTFGMPFSTGQLKNADSIAILTAAGKAVPQDHRVVAQWPDGSVKWLHIDCQVDVPKSGSESFKVTWGGTAPASKPGSDLHITKNGDRIDVDTGAITFSISPGGGGIPENVKVGSELAAKKGIHSLSFVETGPAANTPELRGNWKRPIPDGAIPVELTAAKAEVSIERQSKLACTILVRGWYEGNGRKACKFDVRVTAFAGKPYLKIQHTLTFTEDPDTFFITGVNYGFQLENVEKVQFGGESGKVHEAPAAKGCYLLAPGPEINHNGILIEDAPKKFTAYEMFADGKKLAAGREPAGWVAAQSAKSGVALSVRDFRLLHPKELCADTHSIVAGLWAPHAKLLIDARNPLYGQRIRGETTLEGCACGWAKTHELWVAFHNGNANGHTQALDAVRAGQEPAYGIPDPKQVCDSGALGLLAMQNRKDFPEMERQADTYFAWLIKNAELYRWDGFFNLGGMLIEFDNHRERYSNGPANTWCWRDYAGWILNDGQLADQTWRAFARSGERRLLVLAERISRNIGDESTVHYTNPAVAHAHPLGSAHRHDMSPWGAVVTSYSMDVLGNCDLWFLLGDLRARDILRDYSVDLSAGGSGLRELHGPFTLLVRISEALGDPTLIATAKKLQKADENEVLNPNFRSYTDLYMPLIPALAIAPDETLQKDLLATCDKVVEASKPAQPAWDNFPGEILAWAYLQTKDRKYLDALTSHMRNWRLTEAAVASGDPYSEDWSALRKRMDYMPHGRVKCYINLLHIGRYPTVIRALQAAGLTERTALGDATVTNKHSKP
jgi:hypothetical protein